MWSCQSAGAKFKITKFSSKQLGSNSIKFSPAKTSRDMVHKTMDDSLRQKSFVCIGLHGSCAYIEGGGERTDILHALKSSS